MMNNGMAGNKALGTERGLNVGLFCFFGSALWNGQHGSFSSRVSKRNHAAEKKIQSCCWLSCL